MVMATSNSKSNLVMVIVSSLLAVSLLSCCFFFQPTSSCSEVEKDALLRFKASIHDPFGRLSSWSPQQHDDCCNNQWVGVHCTNSTGLLRVVVGLDLRNTFQRLDCGGRFPVASMALQGEINPSLADLKHLKYLDLSMNYFAGIQIPSFLGSMKNLRYLNLSSSGFAGPIPHQLGNLSSLRSLDLTMNYGDYYYYNDLSQFPDLLLTYSTIYQFNLYIEGGDTRSGWLSRLSSLRYLNLGGVDLSKASTLFESLNNIPSLKQLHLHNCGLVDISLPLSSPSHHSLNLTSLRVLDLSSNQIYSSMPPPWLFRLAGLRHLDLSGNENIQNFLPANIGNLTSLRVLLLASYGNPPLKEFPATLGELCRLRKVDFSGMQFEGNFSDLGGTFSGCIKDSLETFIWESGNLVGLLPEWLTNLNNLTALDLSGNNFNGPILNFKNQSSLQSLNLGGNNLSGTLPKSLGQLPLVELDLSSNRLEGVLTEAHFIGLTTTLQFIYLSGNLLLKLQVATDWAPPPNLETIALDSCQVGPAFPTWISKLKKLSYISMSNAGIKDVMPYWCWNFSDTISYIDLSKNEIQGVLPSSLRHLINLNYIDLSGNHFKGRLPQFSSCLAYLFLSNNSLTNIGDTFNIGDTLLRMTELDVSMNNINGSIPSSICKGEELELLNLSENNISGEIPNCWDRNKSLRAIDLSSNNLSGGFPTTVCSVGGLESLHLNNNNLYGELPQALKNCTRLLILDLGQNKFNGSIPSWIGEGLQNIVGIRLCSNSFVGDIPPELGSFNKLQVLDLSHNNLSGAIPHTIGNLTAMKEISHSNYSLLGIYNYDGNMVVDFRGREDKYANLLRLLVSIDFSENNLTGELPEEIATLWGLQNLNLSGNHLTGKVFKGIGELEWMESLDLSRNNLYGPIPATMEAMHSLNHLNLSFNHFSGKIPSGGQLGVLPDPSIYMGNQDLCGFPLDVKCAPIPEPTISDQNGGTDYSETFWFYMSLVLGFVIGFWAVYCSLLLKRRWRIVYYRFADDIYDNLYVKVAVTTARMKICYSGNNRG